jgi:hypothetical protein
MAVSAAQTVVCLRVRYEGCSCRQGLRSARQLMTRSGPSVARNDHLVPATTTSNPTASLSLRSAIST